VATREPESLDEASLVALALDGRLSASSLAMARDLLATRPLGGAHVIDVLRDARALSVRQQRRFEAAWELARRAMAARGTQRPLGNPAFVAERYRDLALLDREVLVAVALDSRNALRAERRFVGGHDQVQVLPVDLLLPVVRAGASRLLLVHNHPSGDPTPSPSDVLFTHRTIAAAETLGVRLIDHVIVGGNAWTSLRCERLLEVGS